MGNLKLALFLAYKSVIKGNRWTLVLIVLVMSLSFANLCLTPSILSGVTKALDNQQINTLFANIIIDPRNTSYYLEHSSQIIKKLEQVPEIAGVAPHLNGSAFIEYNWASKVSPEDKGKSGNWNIVGIDPDKEIGVTTIQSTMIEGSYLSPDDRDQIVLGVEIAGGPQAQNQPFLTLGGVKAGDKVRLTYPNGAQKEYTVKGIFWAQEAGGVDNMAFVTRKEMASVMGQSVFVDRTSQILVRLKSGYTESQVLPYLKTLSIDGNIRSWKDYGGAIGGVVSSFNMIASLIGGIGLLVAGAVMFIVIYVNVVNKKRQIGILRAIGINSRVIFYSYLIQAVFYALIGIIVGGVIFGYIIKPYFDMNPINLPIGMVRLVIDSSTIRNSIIGLLFAALFAGFIPVFNTTRHSIIKAIWGN